MHAWMYDDVCMYVWMYAFMDYALHYVRKKVKVAEIEILPKLKGGGLELK